MNLSDLFSMVHSFMATMKQATPDAPKMPKAKVSKLRCKLMAQENRETRDAKDIVAAFDGVLDQLYVAVGTAKAYGFNAEQMARGFKEVHQSNMSKLWRAQELAFAVGDIEIAGRDDEGPLFIVKDKDGKVVKSPGYFPPDLSFIRDGQVIEAE